jgi:hypothetical protein
MIMEAIRLLGTAFSAVARGDSNRRHPVTFSRPTMHEQPIEYNKLLERVQYSRVLISQSRVWSKERQRVFVPVYEEYAL